MAGKGRDAALGRAAPWTSGLKQSSNRPARAPPPRTKPASLHAFLICSQEGESARTWLLAKTKCRPNKVKIISRWTAVRRIKSIKTSGVRKQRQGQSFAPGFFYGAVVSVLTSLVEAPAPQRRSAVAPQRGAAAINDCAGVGQATKPVTRASR